MTTGVLFWLLATLAIVGAGVVVWSREVMRLALGLGAFLLALAGLFALFGFGFLALAEVFVYVGGVLILLLFAIMLVHRSEPGAPSLSSRHDPLAAVAAAGVGALLIIVLRPLASIGLASASSSVDDLGSLLLGDLLPHFELVGVLLLAALVAVVAVSGGDER
jgi:NADH-quinone oxidoreductase subunit J